MILVTLAYMHGGVDVRIDGQTYLCTYVRTVDDVMAIKQRFLASMGYHILLTMVLRARALRRAQSSAIRMFSRSSKTGVRDWSSAFRLG